MKSMKSLMRSVTRLMLTCGLTLVVLLASHGTAATAQVVTLGGGNEATTDVVAQGIMPMPKDDVVWRVVRGQAGSRTGTEPRDTDPGFVIATGKTIVVSDLDRQAQSLLGTGEAAWVPGDTRQQRAVPEGADTTYTEISLVPQTDAKSSGAGQLVYAGDRFAPPNGSRDVNLRAGTLQKDQTLKVDASGTSIVVFVASGTVGVSAGGDLGTGDSQAYSKNVTLTNTSDTAARVYVAAIGDTVPDLPTFTGSATLEVRACPDGSSAGSFAPSSCEVVSASDGFAIDLLDQNLTPIPTAGSLVEGKQTWTGLDYGTYLWGAPTMPAPYVGTLWTDTDSKALDRAEVTIDASHLNITHILYVFPVTLGQISVVTLVCPPGMTAESIDGSQCVSPGAGNGGSISLTTPAGSALDAASAATGPGSWLFAGLPVANDGGTYTVDQTTLPAGSDGYLIVFGGSGIPDAATAVSLASDAPAADVVIFDFQPAPAPPPPSAPPTAQASSIPSVPSSISTAPSTSPALGGASVTVAVYGCPAGISPGDTASYDTCGPIGGGVSATLVAPNGTASSESGGSMTFAGLDYGTYSVGLTSLPDGYSAAVAPGFETAASSPDRVDVQISGDNPDPVLTVYLFHS